MLFNILSILLIIGALAGLFWIVSRHADVLSSIDVETVPGEKESEIKNKIVRDRMTRKLGGAKHFLSILSGPLQRLSQITSTPFKKLYENLLSARDAQRKQGMAHIDSAALTGEALRTRITELLTDADVLVRADKMPEAEKRYIDILSLDPKQIRAYKGLADLYMDQREWTQAEESLKYECRLLRDLIRSGKSDHDLGDMSQRLVQGLYDLSVVSNALSNRSAALEYLKQAQELDPRSPKILDALVSQYIEMEQKLKAERVLKQLEEADPGNQKIAEFNAQINQISY